MPISKSLHLLAFMSVSGGYRFRVWRNRGGETGERRQRRLRPRQGKRTRRRRATCSVRGLDAAPSLPIEQANVALEPPTPATTSTGRSSTPPGRYKPHYGWQPPPSHRAGRRKNIEIYSPGFALGGAGLHAERRLGELMAAQAKTMGKATPLGSNQHKQRGSRNPDAPPSLAEGGIDKNLAKRALKRALASIEHRRGECAASSCSPFILPAAAEAGVSIPSSGAWWRARPRAGGRRNSWAR
jgi:hypothetical protein